MPSEKINFTNELGYELSAKLELPVDQHPHSYAIFAHCFTCNKNLSAIRNISRALNLQGIAVLRFDFTGLGESEGDFADTNFSSNVLDLIAAADYLAENHQAPTLLVGHSLGGAAVISAAAKLNSVRAVATVGAPADPAHVSHLLDQKLGEIKTNGTAVVTIQGREFKVKKQFLEDIRSQSLQKTLGNLKKALLIMHSPQDRIVEVENAKRLYEAAFHPKSFISLDGADHLLSQKGDSQYAGSMIAAWAKRYLDLPSKEELKARKQVAVRLDDTGYTTEVMVRHHQLTADEPESVGGNDFGPTPYELVAAGLGACTAMTLKMYARRKKWPLDRVTVQLDHYKDYPSDMQDTEEKQPQIDHFDREIVMEGDLTDEQLQRLLEIANRCPVHRTLNNPVKINTTRK